MKRQFIAGMTALSLAFSGAFANPALADRNDDIARLLLGLAAVAVISNAVKNSRRADPAPAPVYHPPAYRPPAHQPSARQFGALPAGCIIDLPGRGRSNLVIGRRCLERNYRDAAWLPRHCEVRIEGYRHNRSGYDLRCLRHAGFRIDRHH